MYTKLSAVQRIASNLGLQRPSALDTGNPSEAGKIEAIIDEANRDIQIFGWACNRKLDYTIALPTVRIAVSGGSGTFTFGETVTESVTGATGTFNRITGGFAYLAPLTGTFTGGQTLTGATSGATRTGAAYTLSTTAEIGVPDTWLSVSRGSSEARAITTQGSLLYDANDSTTTFDSSVLVHAVELLAFESLPQHIQDAIMARSAIDVQRSFKRSQTEEYLLQNDYRMRFSTAVNIDQRQAPINVYNNPHAQRVVGDRRRSSDAARWGY